MLKPLSTATETAIKRQFERTTLVIDAMAIVTRVMPIWVGRRNTCTPEEAAMLLYAMGWRVKRDWTTAIVRPMPDGNPLRVAAGAAIRECVRQLEATEHVDL